MNSRRARSWFVTDLALLLVLVGVPCGAARAAKGDCEAANQASWPVCETWPPE